MKGRLDQLAIVAKYFIRAKKKCDILHTNKINLILKSAGAVAIRILTHPTDRLMNLNQYCFQWRALKDFCRHNASNILVQLTCDIHILQTRPWLVVILTYE